MSRKKIKASQKEGSLSWLEEIYFERGREAATEAFERLLPEAAVRPYAILRSGAGQPAQRTDTEAQDGIVYQGFSAPAFWDVPYSLLRVRFEHVIKADFIFHGGEEILIPIAGQIAYHFYSSVETPRPKKVTLAPALKPGDIVRINPQLPHHTWAAERAGAEAWMVIRHMSDSASSISINSRMSSADLHPTPRRVTARDLKEPGRYALIAWGLSEKIRLHRERANLRIAQLAAACGIDPSYLSRIENADTNPSLETLVRIARLLHINIEEIIAPVSWCYEIGHLPEAASWSQQPMHQAVLGKPPGLPHFLHFVHWGVPAESMLEVPSRYACAEGVGSSWIVLDGRVIFEIAVGSDAYPELLEKGSVIHFRRAAPRGIQALRDSHLLQVVYSADCFCGAGQDVK
jgi:transcriptional regulator with XRE-family HTH domain